MNKKCIYFVSGVSGVGKTSVIPYLKSLLPSDFEVHDFDENGVPAGADRVWRINTTLEWITLGDTKAREGITIVVCGFSNPDEIEDIQKDFPDLRIIVLLLDGNEEVVEQRLRDRNTNASTRADLERVVGSTEDFIQNNRRFQPMLREICERHGCPSIDTTHLNSEEVAQRIAQLITQAPR